jgi:hypothetical protein
MNSGGSIVCELSSPQHFNNEENNSIRFGGTSLFKRNLDDIMMDEENIPNYNRNNNYISEDERIEQTQKNLYNNTNSFNNNNEITKKLKKMDKDNININCTNNTSIYGNGLSFLSVNNEVVVDDESADNIRLQTGTDKRIRRDSNNDDLSKFKPLEFPLNNYSEISELQARLDKKSEELLQIKSSSHTIATAVIKIQKDYKCLEDENRILKRAVSIQDSRHKELLSISENNHQSKQVELERQNTHMQVIIN